MGDNIRLHYKTDDPRMIRTVRALGALTVSGLQYLLSEIHNKIKLTFSEKLMELIKEKGKKPAEIYKKADITKEVFSKIKRNKYYHPTKETALAFAIALHLNLKETQDLIGRAGYALSSSIKRDLIVQCFIEAGIYDMYSINEKLIDYGFESLTNKHSALKK
ncbi:MAG: XRE family transcriptional regulator [Anaerovibrio sp.]|uniref:XRE family transcriptional regulator n=1 Tax=Anaerovibrio sp. TaxID=1872532 RepID=UPI0026008BCD|nr:XRE family transcriptional regulator [Anaerovibrio sp.]MCR5177139.1 XRE family transcriptional regulator [Anaerovibrio sp.]